MSSLHTPREIKLHQKSHLLEIHFDTGENFSYPCEYLRTHAKSSEIQASGTPVYGKADVNINKIETQGNYALRLYFDDGYNSGIYSWDTLYELGSQYENKWAEYLNRLEKHGLERQSGQKNSGGEINIRLLFFMTKLLKVTEVESEQLLLPESIRDVKGLLNLLRSRGPDWQQLFADTAVQVTVNKQFAELYSRLDKGDEVAFVPVSKDI